MQKYCLLTKPQNISTGNLLKCPVFNIRSQISDQIRALTHYFIYLKTAKRRTGQGRETSAGRQEKQRPDTRKGAEYCRRGRRNGKKRTRRTPAKTNRPKHCGGGNNDPAIPKASFYDAKGHLSQPKRPSFRRQKKAFCNALTINTIGGRAETRRTPASTAIANATDDGYEVSLYI